eukprot:gene1308-3543_t
MPSPAFWESHTGVIVMVTYSDIVGMLRSVDKGVAVPPERIAVKSLTRVRSAQRGAECRGGGGASVVMTHLPSVPCCFAFALLLSHRGPTEADDDEDIIDDGSDGGGDPNNERIVPRALADRGKP